MLSNKNIHFHPKVANLVNGARNMDRDCRVITIEEYEREQGNQSKPQYLRLTVVINHKGEYIRHYWG